MNARARARNLMSELLNLLDKQEFQATPSSRLTQAEIRFAAEALPLIEKAIQEAEEATERRVLEVGP